MRRPVTGTLLGINVGVFLAGVVTGAHPVIVDAVAFGYARLVALDVTSLLLSGFVHTDLIHLAYNAVFLWIFGAACEDEIGGWRTLAIYGTGSVSGMLLFAAVFPGEVAVGASGAVFGLMAAAVVTEPGRPIVEGTDALPVGVLAIVYLVPAVANAFSLAGNVANIAHVGGAVAGAVLAWCWRTDHGLDV